jgi:hypothetical protein
MNIRHIAAISALAMQAFVIVMMPGCASRGIDLVREGTVHVDDQVSREYAHLNHVVVEQKGEYLEVSGELHRNFHQRGMITGHIHVEVIAPDGETIKRVDTGLHHLSSKSYKARFSTRLPVKVLSGSTVRVIFDRTFGEDYH